jgi:hypothetical protein
MTTILTRDGKELLVLGANTDDPDEGSGDYVVGANITFLPTGLFCRHGAPAKPWWLVQDAIGIRYEIICDCDGPGGHQSAGVIVTAVVVDD